jgi:hypothetical protein
MNRAAISQDDILLNDCKGADPATGTDFGTRMNNGSRMDL